MLSFPASVRLYLCTVPVDFRAGFDRLAALVRQHLGGDPLSGHLFLFRNRRGDRLKALYWEPSGFALWYKRLEIGTFQWPTASASRAAVGDAGVEITPAELAMILDGVDLSRVQRRPRYQRPATTSA